MSEEGNMVELAPEQAARADTLHRDSFVILAHDHLFGSTDVNAMLHGGVTAKVVKLTADSLEWDEQGRRVTIDDYEGWTRRALEAMDALCRLVESRPRDAMIVRSIDDIRTAKRERKAGLIMGLEGPRPIEGSIEVLRCLYRPGLREMQLTWAAPNQLITNRRLNEFGERVVQEMNELGMLIDLSHLSDEAFHQALEISTQPMIVSHGACLAVSGGGDCLSDEKIKALAAGGGILALHFISGDYIKPRRGTECAGVDDLIDHVDHIRDLVGIDHVALGGDYFPKAEEDNWAWVSEAREISMMPNVTRGLVRRGYSDEEIAKVLGGNLLRLYGRVWRS